MATNDKYDRQLRLWGPQGQRALMNSNVLLINANATGTETLKNLVLPGVGQFVILDDHIIDSVDLSNNFFVSPDNVGRLRAEVTKELLLEMNPDVAGSVRCDSVERIIAYEPSYFRQFSVIICSNAAPSVIINLSELCHEYNVPLISLRSVGFIGYCRLQVGKHDIIESHPDNELVDLRLSSSFPLLEKYCAEFDMSVLNSMEHSHVPYIVILCTAIKKWRNERGGELPKTMMEKEAFKEHIKACSKDYTNEVNFQEAIKEFYRATSNSVLPEEVVELVESQSGDTLTKESSAFSWLLRALECYIQLHRRYIGNIADNSGVQWNDEITSRMMDRKLKAEMVNTPPLGPLSYAYVPLSGYVPDMTSSTNYYIDLQKIYATQADDDKELLTLVLQAIYSQIVNDDQLFAVVPVDTIAVFCKNISQLRSLKTSIIADEYYLKRNGDSNAPFGDNSRRFRNECESAMYDPYDDESQTPILWYIALKGIEFFHMKHGRYPGASPTDVVEEDAQEVWLQMSELVRTLSGGSADDNGDDGMAITLPVCVDHAIELTRVGGGGPASELHNIAAFIGGLASQEIVKLLTNQFIPMNNTFIYNGISGCGAYYTM